MFSTSLLRLSANRDAGDAQDAAASEPCTEQPVPQQAVYPQQQMYYVHYPVDNLAMMQYNLLLMQQMHAQRQPQQSPLQRQPDHPHSFQQRAPPQTGQSLPQQRRAGSHQHLKKRSECEEEDEERVEEKISLTGLLSKSNQSKEEVAKWVRARRFNFPTRENILRKERAIAEDGEAGKMKESELSVLEVKLRKKLMIMDYNPYEEKRLHRERKTLLHRINSRKRLQAHPEERRTPASTPHDKKAKKEKRPDRKQPPETAPPADDPRKPRAHTAQDIIEHLQARSLEDHCAIESFIRDKPQSDRFRHQQNSLLSHLLLADIYRERSIVLQAVRHLVKQDFLQPPQTED